MGGRELGFLLRWWWDTGSSFYLSETKREDCDTTHFSTLYAHNLPSSRRSSIFSPFSQALKQEKQLKNIEKRFLTFSREVEWKLKEIEIYFDCRRCLLLLVLLFLNDLIFPSLFCFAAGFDTRNQSWSWQFGDTSKFNSSGRWRVCDPIAIRQKEKFSP